MPPTVPDPGEPDEVAEAEKIEADYRAEPGSDAELELLRASGFPRGAWSVALDDARKKREREQRALTPDEVSELRRFYPVREFTQAEQTLLYGYTGQVWDFDPLPPWEHIEAELLVEPESAKMARLLDLQLADAERQPANDDDQIGRPLEPLVLADVLLAEQDLKKRAALPKPPRSGPLTYSAIARRTKLNRDRLHELEELMRLGWPLSKSHPDPRLRKSRPDFPADAEPVWLPTPRQARRLPASG
jgi:hypothetical protein